MPRPPDVARGHVDELFRNGASMREHAGAFADLVDDLLERVGEFYDEADGHEHMEEIETIAAAFTELREAAQRLRDQVL